MEEQRSCRTCTHYLPTVSEAGTYIGQRDTVFGVCRRYPKTAMNEVLSFYPRHVATDVCGEHQPTWYLGDVRKEPVVDKELTEVTEGYLEIYPEPEEETPKKESEVRITGSEEAMNRGKRGRRGKK